MKQIIIGYTKKVTKCNTAHGLTILVTWFDNKTADDLTIQTTINLTIKKFVET